MISNHITVLGFNVSNACHNVSYNNDEVETNQNTINANPEKMF